MEDKFLQSFLTTGIFDIGDSDDRLKWLQDSITDLQKKFDEDYSLLPKYSLVAIDPNIPESEQALVDTEALITVHWKALRGKYPEMPRTLIRGVILNALYQSGLADPLAARIIFLSAANFYPYAKLNSEKKIVTDLLTKFGDIAEQSANEEWSFIETEPELKLNQLKVSGFKPGAVKIDDSKLAASLKTAAKHSPEGYQQHAHPNEWSEHFAKHVTPAITTLITDSLAAFGKSLDASVLETSVNKFFTEFKGTLDESLKLSFSSMRAVERRSKLLWWKETIYSSSQRKSYRAISKEIRPLVMAFDLNRLLPAVTPISVDFLLRDTLFLLNDKVDGSIKIEQLLAELNKEENANILKGYFENRNEQPGRISLTDFIGLLVHKRVQSKDLKAKTGLDPTEEVLWTDLSIVILHDLLVERLITE